MDRALCFFVACAAVTCFRAVAQNSSPQQTTPEAQVRLGNTYLAQKDYSLAMTWFRKAAGQGNAVAQNNIGWLYENGFGIQRDYAEAVTWYRKAADQGNTRAQENIGALYEKGLGVNQDYGEAMIWHRKAADQGNANAQVNVGWLYQNGWGVKQDYPEALRWYLGAANKGNAYAQNDIGCLYENGLGVDRDYAVAMAWYYRAADQGHAEAENNIGLLYRNGLGDKQDYGKAMTWFRKAADQGLAKAQANVGWLYENGLGVSRDYAEAMAWYRKSAQQGSALAQNNIGWLYQNGWGVKQDYAEAMTWYRKAAEQGNARAKANIEWLSQNGWQGDQAHGTTLDDVSVRSTSEKENVPAPVLPNGIRAPRAIYQPEPEYSEEARKAMFTGAVLLWLTVGPDGQPRNIKVVAPLGVGLDEKAVDAVKMWKFEPATKDGKPVAVEIMIEVDFRLYGLSGVGKVEIVTDPDGANLRSYLSSIILEAGKCWSKATADKTRAPLLKKGQVAIQFSIGKNLRIGATEIASSSGDDVLDRDARDCVSPLSTDKPLPAELNGNDLIVRMQLLYNMGGVSLNPVHPQIAAGSREQFYIETAGILSKAADWSVTGIGCTDAACGTISTEGLYTAPDVLPKPPFVRVKGTLAGANPIPASAVVTLTQKH